MLVTVGFEGGVHSFKTDPVVPKSRRSAAYEILDEWLAYHATEAIGRENLGDYGFDEWDVIKGTVSGNAKTLMFAARPCNGKSAMFFVSF